MQENEVQPLKDQFVSNYVSSNFLPASLQSSSQKQEVFNNNGQNESVILGQLPHNISITAKHTAELDGKQ